MSHNELRILAARSRGKIADELNPEDDFQYWSFKALSSCELLESTGTFFLDEADGRPNGTQKETDEMGIVAGDIVF